jgi:hypothetical protein
MLPADKLDAEQKAALIRRYGLIALAVQAIGALVLVIAVTFR